MATPTIKFFPNVRKMRTEDGYTPVYIRLFFKDKKVEGKTPLSLTKEQVKKWYIDYYDHNSSLTQELLEYRKRFRDYIHEKLKNEQR